MIRARGGERATALSNFSPPISVTATPMAYSRAVKQFFDWCDERRLKHAGDAVARNNPNPQQADSTDT
jgi:hypothetical protein